MTEQSGHIHSYYSPGDLYRKIVAGLETLGKDLATITLDDLQPVDEFHIRGDTATRELIELAGFSPDMHILDVGCGIGGSSRRLSRDTGCRVTGIDLSDEYIDTASRLTDLLKMQERVTFQACSALDLPFEDSAFDGIWSLQMNMNIEDKSGWLREIHRVLKPGGKAVLYEVCGSNNSPLVFPVPWAQDAAMSYLVTPERFRDAVVDAGFTVQVWTDKTGLARKAFANAKQPEGEPDLPALGVYLLVGNDIQLKAYNLRRNLEEDRVTLLEIVAVKADSDSP
ncbi:MAG: methyltransferase domain-containing protein [Gammaproteobacteria bacterium]|nr:class I SAM-dependent methyltransferase [Pseudomonadales bacterium]MCP5348002.1 class I SAM-dependent methyltransferase [Pseudomonadales bacterium]